jgi:hypothetical protein
MGDRRWSSRTWLYSLQQVVNKERPELIKRKKDMSIKRERLERLKKRKKDMSL